MACFQRLLEDNNWHLKPSQGDGHCFIYSLVSLWNAQCKTRPKIDIHEVKSRFFIESVYNFEKYLSLLNIIEERECTTFDYFCSLRKFLLDKVYNLPLVDIAPNIISNAFNIDIDIWNETITSGVYKVDVSPSGSTVQDKIVLHRKSDHYNGMVPCNHKSSMLKSQAISYSSLELKKFGNVQAHSRVSRRTRKRLFELHIWRPKNDVPVLSAPHRNLVIIKPELPKKIAKNILFCSLNCQSVKNKALSLQEYIISNDFDLVALTETWPGSSSDKQCPADLLPAGYHIKHIPRKSSTGGGVALLYKSGLSVRQVRLKDSVFTQFEYMICDVEMNKMHLQITIIISTTSNQKKWADSFCLL